MSSSVHQTGPVSVGQNIVTVYEIVQMALMKLVVVSSGFSIYMYVYNILFAGCSMLKFDACSHGNSSYVPKTSQISLN